VAAAWPYFQERLVEIPQVWLGGFSGPGAVLGAVLAAVLFARSAGLPIGGLAEALLPLAASMAVSGWLACWLAGCAYGAPSPWGIPVVDEWGQLSPRLPVQPVGALLALLLFWLLERALLSTPARRRNLAGKKPGLLLRLAAWLQSAPPGTASSGLLSLLSLETAGLSCLRGDPAPLILGLRVDALAWAALALLFSLALWLFTKSARNTAPASPDQPA
jgi:hypothetical protein